MILLSLKDSALKGSERVKGPSILGGGTGTWMLAIGFFFASWMVSSLQWHPMANPVASTYRIVFCASRRASSVFIRSSPSKKNGSC